MFVLGQKCSKIDKNKWIPHTVPFKKVFIGPRSCMWTLSRLISTILIYLKWHQKWCIITKKGAISRWVKKKDHQKKAQNYDNCEKEVKVAEDAPKLLI
jgi:hypothetical protein